MIKFQTPAWEWDLSNLGLSFNEASDYFSNKISKSFSFPANIKITDDVAIKLGLVNHNNVSSYTNKIYGYLTLDNAFYDAYISINDTDGETAEITFFYGKEVLSVFDKNLNELPFPIIIANGGLPSFAKTQISKFWPEATHNFPKIWREDIKQKANYSHFEYFINNYVNNSGWEFPVNTTDLIEGVNTVVNRNIMAPFPYLLEIFKIAFKSEGLEIRGEFVNDDLIKKILLVPKNYFEKFAVTQYDNYSFNLYTRQETISGKTVNVFEKIHTPTEEGSYSLKIRVNLSNAQAQYFSLTVVQNFVTLYEAKSTNKRVVINEEIDINIVNTDVFNPIKVELKLYSQHNSIAPYNNFTYEFKEGQLNIFPETYSLADFMPDINFREFINRIKTWFNLKFDYTENAVYINYLDNAIGALNFIDKSHLEQPKPKRKLSENNLFKLNYLNKQEVFFSKEGQIYSTTDFVDQETTKIPIEVLPLEVNENKGSVTAIYPEDDEDLMFCLYNGLLGNEPLAVDKINNESLNLQDVVNKCWVNWLRFRANSETYKDSFQMHVSETLNIKEGIFKYNKNHLIKTKRTKRIDEENWQVDVESETL